MTPQYNWVDNLIFVSTETLDVEYGVGSLKLDHWAFGPHHVWTDPATGLVVRMWQPFNGLQVFTPGSWKTEITTEGQGYLDELAADGKTAPKAAMPGGSTFRIKCGDDGFHQDSLDVPHQSSTGDLHRARTKKPVPPTLETTSPTCHRFSQVAFEGGAQQPQLR